MGIQIMAEQSKKLWSVIQWSAINQFQLVSDGKTKSGQNTKRIHLFNTGNEYEFKHPLHPKNYQFFQYIPIHITAHVTASMLMFWILKTQYSTTVIRKLARDIYKLDFLYQWITNQIKINNINNHNPTPNILKSNQSWNRSHI